MLHNDHPWELFQLHSSGIPSPQINKGLPKDQIYLLFCLPKHSWTLICPIYGEVRTLKSLGFEGSRAAWSVWVLGF